MAILSLFSRVDKMSEEAKQNQLLKHFYNLFQVGDQVMEHGRKVFTVLESHVCSATLVDGMGCIRILDYADCNGQLRSELVQDWEKKASLQETLDTIFTPGNIVRDTRGTEYLVRTSQFRSHAVLTDGTAQTTTVHFTKADGNKPESLLTWTVVERVHDTQCVA